MLDRFSSRGTLLSRTDTLAPESTDHASTGTLTTWRERLARAPVVLSLPTDHPRPAQQTHSRSTLEFTVGAPLRLGLEQLSQRQGVTLGVTLLAAWGALLARLAGQTEVVIATEPSGESHTLAVPLSVAGDPQGPVVARMLAHAREAVAQADQHQRLPFDQWVGALGIALSPAYAPLAQAGFQWRESGGTGVEEAQAGLDLNLAVSNVHAGLECQLRYNPALFTPATVERFAGYWRTLLAGMVAEPDRSVMALTLLDNAEYQQRVYAANARQLPFDAHLCLHGLFEAQAARQPDAVAARFGEQVLSYGVLNAQANRLAHYLRSLGVGPDTRVGLCLERSLDMLVGLLAVLKAGGAYVPLDPTYPQARLAHMLADSAAPVVLTQRAVRRPLESALTVAELAPSVLELGDTHLWAGQATTNPDPQAVGLTSRHLAYVIYTSGSTGTPKGVLVEHQGLVAVSAAWAELYPLAQPLNHLQMAGFSFDVFSADVIRSLCFGGTLVMCPAATLLDPPALYQLLVTQRIGFGDFVPAVLNPLLAWLEDSGHDLAFMRTLVCGSDVWTAHSAARLRRLCSPQAQIVQAYGVTEASIDSACYEVGPAGSDEGVLPIGQALPNTRLYVLDALGAPVPTGVTGELYIGGVGVARGYLNLPALTAERFVDNPFVPGERLYRSGDLARCRIDGNLEFLGRNDFQAKLRGLRLELGDIEAQLAQLPGIAQCLVLLREDIPGEQRLVAYYRERVGAGLTPGSLRQQLAAQLPGYMVPAAYVGLAAMPLTANGKLDRTALPVPNAEAFEQRAYAAPEGELETALAAIWAEVLGTDRVGRDDHFFDLGGHSLLVMRVLAHVRQHLHAQVSPAALFTAPTLQAFAQHVAEGLNAVQADTSTTAAIPRIDAQGPQPLSSAQERLWFLAQLQGGNAAYHMPLNLRLRGVLHPPALEAAFGQLIARHEALRTRFIAVEGEGRQCVEPAAGFTLPLLDLSEQADAPAQLQAHMAKHTDAPFDLAQGPLLRACLVRLAADEHVLLLTQHHIISDGWSVGVLTRELGLLYEAALEGREADVAPLPLRYVDYAAWQRHWLTGSELERQVAYWRQALAGAPVLLDLPTDHKRPPAQNFQGGFVPLVLDRALTAQLKALCKAQGVTLFMALLAGWSLVLARLAGQADVVIGVPSANRTQPELEGLLGFFVNTLGLRMTHKGTPSVREWLHQARQVALEAQAHQVLPFEQVVEALNPPRSLAHSPVFQVLFAWEQDQGPGLALTGLEVTPVATEHRVAKFDLQLALSERDGQITGGLEYASSLFEPASVVRFGDCLTRVLTQMVEDAQRPVSALDLLGAEQRHQVLYGWNATEAEPGHSCLATFEAVAEQAPDAVALIAGQAQWRYGELDRAANRLAHQLVSLGVGPEQCVGISLERSPAMVIGVLAILKAGGAYVPFDPAYPRDRLAFMFSDAAPKVVLTQASLCDLLPIDNVSASVEVLCLDRDASAWAHQPASRPEVTVGPAHLGYVLYTSGSTGQPKGVAHTRAALDNLIAWQLSQAPTPPPRRVLQFASLNFDVSFQEIFSTLCQGSTLVLMTEASRKDLAALPSTLVSEGVERAFLPFAVLQQLAALGDTFTPAAGCEIITAGEALQVNEGLRAFVRGLGGRFLHNQYGPTETHVVSQFSLACEAADSWPESPPIGRPIANARLYVLDTLLEPVPIGVAGELYIGGACLARGYLNRPELTAERFLPDPFSHTPGARMYRSGDLARWLAEGNVQYLGRVDHQVKVRGLRVELGEIESLLQRQPGVREAAVLQREDVPGDPRLVAYVVGDVEGHTLRAALAQHLPEPMLPSAWMFLAQLPLTGNGKVDRRALPAPERAAGADYVAPINECEQQMAQIWADVLKRERVGREDHFFELGGHSLLATRMVYAINQRLGGQVALSDLFEAPILKDLAARVAARPAGDAHLEATFELVPDPHNRHAPFPLTDIQQAYWFGREASVGLGGVSAHGYEELRMPGLDLDRFERALNRMIQRHDMLRVVFRSDGTQQVLADVPEYRLPRHDLRGLPAEVARQALEATRQRQSHQVLDASCWPLFEFAVTLLDDGITHLHISLDALIVDAASTQILARELMACYADPACALVPPGLTFRDYVLAEQYLRQGPRYERALAYWRERAATLAPAPELPQVRQPESLTNPHFTRRDRELSAAQWSQLKAVAKQFAVTPSVMLLTAFSQVLALWSRQPRFTLSLPLFNRLPLHADVDAIIGDFTSVALLEVAIDGTASFSDNAWSVQARLWQAMDHAVVSGVKVLRELSQARGVQQSALPVVFNSTLSEAAPELAEFNLADALNATPVHSITQTPQVWLDHTLLELEGRLLFNWDSIDELFPHGLMDAMFGAYNHVLDQLADPTNWLASTPHLLPVARLPEPEALPAAGPLMHDLFEHQALRTPEALAVADSLRSLTYGQLRQEARHLGARLQAAGVAPGERVAVTMVRGWEQVAGTLGILYAGAAYLPLDPTLPAQRKHQICERAGVRWVVTQPWLLDERDGLEAVSFMAVTPLSGGHDDVQGPALQPVCLPPEALAYVIYTSGSTGQPKGVAIDHRGAVNTLLDINQRFAVGPTDRVLAISSLSFDLSVYDFFGTLATGAAVVVLDPQLALDPAHWQALIQQHRVTLWNSVPALFGMWLEYLESQGATPPPSLRLVMMSGDWIPLTLPSRAWALNPQWQLISLGGATEASIWSIYYPIQRMDPAWRSVPYGKALDHQRFYVLDDALQARPAWVPGQLYIGGVGLAQGYWQDEALSAASFFPHPLTGERLYRTGDLGRLLPDGNIEFLGREDNQVKVQGYRIELGEIEAVLNRHPGVDSAVIRVLGQALEEKRLAGYVLRADPLLQAADLTQYLRATLAPYMVPRVFTFVEAWPLSANGKVDKKRLPEPAAAAFEAEQGSTVLVVEGEDEQQLVAIVQSVLKQAAIAADANLLSLGATSIDIVRISNALSSALGFRPHVAQLLAQPTLHHLLALYRSRPQQEVAGGATPPALPIVDTVIEDPQQRATFKAEQRGRRRFEGGPEGIALGLPATAGFAQRYSHYRSVRQYAQQPVAPQALAGLLAPLAQGRLNEAVKYQFPSAGGLYPLQTYLYFKPGQVEGFEGGAYYYDPCGHRLVALNPSTLDPDVYDYFVNRPVYEGAAFALFLIADMAAISPLYGARSRDFCHIEAGAITQLLIMAAADQGLGLCGIGSLEEDSLVPLFALSPTHQLIYAMVGGVRGTEQPTATRIETFMPSIPTTTPAPTLPSDDSEMEEIEL